MRLYVHACRPRASHLHHMRCWAATHPAEVPQLLPVELLPLPELLAL
jgi:hypothetical protein